MNKYNVKAKGVTDLLPHKYIGISQAKEANQLTDDKERAERFTYRDKNGMLCIPVECIRATIINGFVGTAGPKQKTKTKMHVSPRIRVQSLSDYDLTNVPLMLNGEHITSYEIDRRSYSAGGRSGGIRDFCVRAKIPEWEIEFQLISTVDISKKDLKYKLDFAGSDVGVLSNRVNGYGRFEITNLQKI